MFKTSALAGSFSELGMRGLIQVGCFLALSALSI